MRNRIVNCVLVLAIVLLVMPSFASPTKAAASPEALIVGAWYLDRVENDQGGRLFTQRLEFFADGTGTRYSMPAPFNTFSWRIVRDGTIYLTGAGNVDFEVTADTIRFIYDWNTGFSAVYIRIPGTGELLPPAQMPTPEYLMPEVDDPFAYEWAPPQFDDPPTPPPAHVNFLLVIVIIVTLIAIVLTAILFAIVASKKKKTRNVFCVKCGHILSQGAGFCKRCGYYTAPRQ